MTETLKISPELERALERVPRYMAEQVRNYVMDGEPPGDFLQAVLENNLHQAAMRADDNNSQCLFGWAWVLNALPLDMWQSLANVQMHIKRMRKQREQSDD